MSLLHGVISQDVSNLGFLENRRYVTTDKKVHYSIGLGGPQWNPSMYNRDGFTVFSLMGNIENNHEQYMYIYNHNTDVLSERFSWGLNVLGNYHAYACTLILPSGHILTANSIIHNESVSIKKSTNPYDLSSYSEISVFNENNPAYFSMVLSGSRIYAVYRDQFERDYVTYSDDEGVTWATSKKILELPTDNWAYPRIVFNGTEINLICNVREGAGGDYSKAYFLKSTDGLNFSNISGSFSKDLDVDGHFTETELNTNCEIGLDVGFVTGGITCQLGHIWVWSNVVGLLVFNGTTWLNKNLTFTGYTNINAITLAMLNTDGNNYTIFLGGTRDTDVFVMLKVTTKDAFETITFEEFINPRPYTPIVTHNYNETKQTPLAFLERTYYDFGPLEEPFNSYSNFWFYN